MFKTAIVGCGSISKTHIDALKNTENTEIIAFCDSNENNLNKAVQEHGGNGYTSLEEMLDKEKIDVVHICTPHYLHVPMAIEALKRNVNVLMEKPVAISYEQYRELENAEKNSDARLGICFQNRYNESVIKTKEYLDSNTFGKVLGARAIVTWCRNESYYINSGWRGQLEKEGGGVLINQSIHTLDLATYLLGTPNKVSAMSANFHLKGVINEEDTVSAFLEYEDKTVIFFATTAYCKSSPIILEIVCEQATLRIEGNTLKISHADGHSEFVNCKTEKVVGKACWGAGHRFLISDYYNRLENGTDFPVTLESSKPSFDTMMAIYNSANTNKTINIGV